VSSVTTWAEALDTIAEAIYSRNLNFIETVTNDEYLSRFIGQDASAFYNSAEILDTGYYIDTGTNTNRKRQLIAALGNAFNLGHDDVKAELTAKKKNEEDEE
jgi:hypothetical protein